MCVSLFQQLLAALLPLLFCSLHRVSPRSTARYNHNEQVDESNFKQVFFIYNNVQVDSKY